MPVNFCLPKDRVESFVSGLRSGDISPDKLAKMSSKERHDFLGKFVGEDAAKKVNAEFETKLLLKNQQIGMINWAKNVSGIKPTVRQDMIQRIKNIEKVLDPEEEKEFLSDLAATRIGADVTVDEARTIAKMSRTLQEAKAKMKPETHTFSSLEDRMKYGRAVVEMEDYVSDLKNATKQMRLSDVRRNPVGVATGATKGTLGLTKSLTASLDNSIIGRQGLKVAFTHPTIWAKNSLKTFKDWVRAAGNKQVMQEVRAEIMSRPNAINGTYKREKLALGNHEEDFPTSLPSKIPIAGRLFKGSEASFTAFQYRTRADLMDQFVNLAEKTGGDIKGMGLIANSLTGRGRLGKFETAADTLNNAFFSPRFMKSNIDALTFQVADYGHFGTLAKKEAAKNSIKIILGLAGVIALAKTVLPDSVDIDPRSTDFGRIKVGNTRFDISGGMGGYITLALRLLPTPGKDGWSQYSKSGSGKMTNLREGGFGSRDAFDVFLDFFTNKASPSAGAVIDVLRGEDFQGDKPTAEGTATKLFMPIGIQNYNELKDDPNSANILLAMIADGLGFGTNTFSGQKKESWKDTKSKELNMFKDKVGDEVFKKANKEFDDRYNEFVNKVTDDEAYQAFTDEQKQSTLQRQSNEIRKDVLKSYGFKYKAPKGEREQVDNLLKGY